ncbi:phosphatidylethanolamine-binding protein [Kalaharituber pfeilii]|nr:phosphatidylethanolamine-binding protein [Kalaharituber pfeilii]
MPKMLFSGLRIPALFTLAAVAKAASNLSPLNGLFDTLSPFINFGNLTITYNSNLVLQGSINSGVEFTPNETVTPPESISLTPFAGPMNPLLPFSTSQLYTLVMIDPDAPSREDPTVAQVVHMVQTSLVIELGMDAGMTVSQTVGLMSTLEPLIPYRGPAPPEGSGLHRYIFLLFPQPTLAINLNGASSQNRTGFDVEMFARDNLLGPPLAGAYFVAQNGGSADDRGLVVDKETPTRPLRATGTETLTLRTIVYDGTLTASDPEITEPAEAGEETAPVDIGDWTLTAPGDGEAEPTPTGERRETEEGLVIDTSALVRHTMTPLAQQSEDDEASDSAEKTMKVASVDTSTVGWEGNGSGNEVEEAPACPTPSDDRIYHTMENYSSGAEVRGMWVGNAVAGVFTVLVGLLVM